MKEVTMVGTYEELVAAAVEAPFRGWGFDYLTDLLHDQAPAKVAATESWAPNIPVAQKRLADIGVELRPSRDEDPLPAANAEFTLVLNRHGGCNPLELRRVLTPGGVYIAQGVGRLNDIELNLALDGPPPGYRDTATLDHDAAELIRNGFKIIDSGATFAEYGFLDIGAVVYHLTAVSWQVPGFDVTAYDEALRELDARIRADGEFMVRHHRYFIKAVAPDLPGTHLA